MSHIDQEPWYRPAGRVLVADPSDRILLLRVEDATTDLRTFWLTPGGACEGEESQREAAIRELREETGITTSELGPLVWRRRHQWRWGDRMVDSEEAFFFLKIHEVPELRSDGAGEQELGVLKEFRWWHPDELKAATDKVFVPRRLATLIEPVLAGNLGDVPIDAGI